MLEKEFILNALNNVSGVWQSETVDNLAKLDVPHNLLGRRRALLKGDINEQWARWFVESLVDPRRVSEEKISYASLFNTVLNILKPKLGNDKTINEIGDIAAITSRIIMDTSRAIDVNRQRLPLTFEEKRFLLDISGLSPRCWICGSEFTDAAIENYLYGRKYKLEPPPFVDILKPRGLVERDLTIEIDHVVPFSKGGNNADNLKLACGWCNRNKGARMSIYDAEGQPRIPGINSLKISTLPQPFWSVRLLALSNGCEHPNGCKSSTFNAELTVVSTNQSGAMNPTNLRVTCYDHDPIKSMRLQSPKLVKNIWGG
jgi:hypothetical protein